ncbi:hypothetical protein WJX84_008369 [Apatococcus fuscideae]|uniref:Uncharacterized protein n=1 Tax=Apatococcus fuscideae TaxID=2026836 RepID=A0AAW1SN04_9CHLO
MHGAVLTTSHSNLLLCWALLITACISCEGAQGQNPPVSPLKTTLNDLVVVFGTTAHDDHISLSHATRAWRKGIRAVIVQNEKPTAELLEAGARHSELYLDYPDRENSATFHSQYPGDVRLALAPFLAAKHLDPSTYKWLLVGDDDTFWFLEGVLKLTNDLDHTLPYIITDERYWHNWERPHVPRFIEDGAPRCLPCNFNPAGEQHPWP